MKKTWLLLKEPGRDGADNMAFDYFLLMHPPECPVVRFYTWIPPAVSLGYNQKHSGINLENFSRLGIDLVRRPTGGRSVYHDKEITYSVVIPPGHPFFDYGIHKLYGTISKTLAAGLIKYGIPVVIERNKPAERYKLHGQGICFDSTARFEVKYRGRKMIGSAQRRMPSGILQQGSILLQDEQHILTKLLGNRDMDENELQNLIRQEDHGRNYSSEDRNDIICSLIEGFENELGCTWISDYDNTPFLNQKEQLKERFSIHRTRFHTIP